MARVAVVLAMGCALSFSTAAPAQEGASPRPFGATGTGRPLSGADKPLAPIGTKRPFGSIGGGGGDAVPPPKGSPPPASRLVVNEPKPQVVVVEAPPPVVIPVPVKVEPAPEPDSGPPVEIGPSPETLELFERVRRAGHEQLVREQFHLAEASFEAALQLVKGDARTYLEHGYAAAALGRSSVAAPSFASAVRLDGELLTKGFDFERVLGGLHVARRAEESAARFRAAYGLDADALYVDGLLALFAGRHKDAAAAFAALERIAPESPRWNASLRSVAADHVPVDVEPAPSTAVEPIAAVAGE